MSEEMKLCKDCANYVPPKHGLAGFSFPHECRADSLLSEPDVIKGARHGADPVSARADESLCGQDAKCFVQKSEKQASFWRRIVWWFK